ncbi:MAG: integrase [Mesorhizobium sp.]|uniref:tyrosine-type recombinase/integrase n=2 Tax=Mesorhizobium TaxID=68287 RepID=UPI000F74FF0F|nr:MULTISPECIES: integrase [unclassified Mesorhizobium]AZO66485.1 integrase [Mesorhizobium sp. M6A.T.Cr.TU.016.01.1.1]RUU44414.1 integrase [Mesorhizobium sp. M6A.T.Ce.TU.002.03.1.1]RWN34832.1 MAG: integrase [Mesorhizobium sp.]RWO95493.1 MAG: integrase [Mesorhizobium sp.]RWP46326.1 MAG: integrase [Mesorhizobium sp.]
MRRSAAPRPHKREGIWYLVRRVPKEFAAFDRRCLVRISTGVAVADDPRGVRARDAVQSLGAGLEAYWRRLREGQSAEAGLRFEAARKRARSFGLAYRTNEELAAGPLDELMARIKLLLDKKSIEDAEDVSAVMGGEKRPAVRLSGLIKEFETIEQQNLLTMSPNQIKKWRNPKKRAVANLVGVIGDKEIASLTRDDAVAFREWWQKRIVEDGLDIGTANKDIGHVSKMLRVVDLTHQLKLEPVFRNLRLSGAVPGQRAAFPAEFIQEKILAEGALDGLNDEARHLIYVIADTGLRLSEAANLTTETIHLDQEIPHVRVRPNGRRLKTGHSARDIPLVGGALAAIKLHPDGFPRYRDKAASLSALVNKVLASKELLPTSEHSLYSLRHTFEDRLTAVEAPEKVIASLMGHKWIRPKYGAGPSLAQKREWLQKIAFTPPGRM